MPFEDVSNYSFCLDKEISFVYGDTGFAEFIGHLLGPRRLARMKLEQLLHQNKTAILQKWHDLLLERYPEQSRAFFRKQKNQFANPVGHAISEGIQSIFEGLLQGGHAEGIPLFLDNIVRVRAVQEFTPSQALEFLFGLKKVIRQELGNALYSADMAAEWAAFESRIDDLALLGFDVYTECRHKLFEVRVEEVKRRSERLLKMAGLVYEIPEEGEANSDSNG